MIQKLPATVVAEPAVKPPDAPPNGSDYFDVRRNKFRALVRLVIYVVITMYHIIIALIQSLVLNASNPRAGNFKSLRLMSWANNLNKALGISVAVKGWVPHEAALLVANHRSYIDITAIGGLVPATFLAKQEVSHWPVLGYGCTLVDVVFVDRKSPESRKQSRNDVAERLNNGMSVIIFPEGTSFEGPGLLQFRPGIFQVASESGFPVVPVAIEYDDPSDAWVGEDTFLRHFMQTFSKKSIPVTVTFGPKLRGANYEILRNASWDWINTTLMSDPKILQYIHY